MSHRAVEILLVEDNAAEARLTKEVLGETKLRHHFHHFADGNEALGYLLREGQYAHARRPHLILLDLNLPGRGGHALLADIKSDAALKRIPVVILSGSQAEEDILRAYELNANCYISKPLDFEELTKVVRTMAAFWLSIVKLPANE